MRLYWVRHGQMEIRASASLDSAAINRFFNQEEQGELSPRGKREAARVAERFGREGIDGLYASPLLRARDTARIVGESLGMPVEIRDSLIELRTGHLSDQSRSARYVRTMLGLPIRAEIKRAVLGGSLIPLYFRAWRLGKTVGGESPSALDARIRGLIAELSDKHPREARIALVAHGYLIFTLAHSLARTPFERAALWSRPYIPNGAITEMELDGDRLRMVRYADARHLRA
jgi:broad specificity phosphatase PhoE